jgi:ubiquinone/menaquinone biosynthesis C-methylase UbiE
MAEVVGAEGKVFAIDSDEKPIKRLRSVSARLGLQNIEASVESAAHLDSIGDHSLDFILANLVLCCMIDHAGPIGEIKRTLRPDGSAYLSDIRVRRSKDPRNVTQDEWQSILGGFRITTERTGLFTRSAVVALRP